MLLVERLPAKGDPLGTNIKEIQISTVFLISIISLCTCQYGPAPQQAQYQPEPYINKPPPPQILSHKQALNHDGNFKYVFTAENGLAQGESIAPDGSRNGGYSYVDPNGKKISVKYTAGKEGFRVIEGDHLPRAPQPLHPLPVVPQQSAAQPYTAAAGQYDDGQYRPQVYDRPAPQAQYYGQTGAYTQARPYQQAAPSNNEISREPEYNDEPGKAHSFGNGYIFEFAG